MDQSLTRKFSKSPTRGVFRRHKDKQKREIDYGYNTYDNQWLIYVFRAENEQYIDRYQDEANHGIKDADIKPIEG